MNILHAFWRYWKWLCVALMTSFIVLGLLAAIVNYLKPVHINDDRPAQCLDAGGTWDEGEDLCKTPA